MTALPFIVTVSQAFNLTTMWCCLDWWNAWWSESDSSIPVNVIWLQLTSLVISECGPRLILMVLVKFALWQYFSLKVKHGGPSSGFSRGISFVKFRLAEAAQVIGSPEDFNTSNLFSTSTWVKLKSNWDTSIYHSKPPINQTTGIHPSTILSHSSIKQTMQITK